MSKVLVARDSPLPIAHLSEADVFLLALQHSPGCELTCADPQLDRLCTDCSGSSGSLCNKPQLEQPLRGFEGPQPRGPSRTIGAPKIVVFL